MATDINIKSLFPAIQKTQVSRPATDISNTTFIGIDFGTSTTVVSIATLDKETKDIRTEPVWLNQKLSDGTLWRAEKIPTVIARHNGETLVGKGAADLKYKLKKGVNVWYSFKMELGEDLGSKYYNSELDRNSDTPILNPKDAARVFFQYLKAQIDRYVKAKDLPANLQFAVSIPASFEANQRKELIYALEKNGISINKQSLIDEPNAAFLSYVQVSSQENNPLRIPEGDNPKVLVFDFGAGTCDVSILELGKDLNGIYSKNLSISKFEKLGGDDIDKYIAIEYLFPEMLKESNKKISDFGTPEKDRIITKLLPAAEQLKIMICEAIALQTTNKILPTGATGNDFLFLGYQIKIDSRQGWLTLNEPKLSFQQFNQAMKTFLKSSSLVPVLTKNVREEFITIFSPIQSALKKASLVKKEIDYVLFIGGSSKNPYVQAALKEYFGNDSKLLVPRDLQTHVSAGAAIHSLVYNGFNKNIIQPITSEPFIVITKDETPKIILRAGTHIPCDLILIDDLVTSHDGQAAIELPICVGSPNKMIFNLKIVCSNANGYKRKTPVKLSIEITTDKLLIATADVGGVSAKVELHPFSNNEESDEQRYVRKAEQQANIEAEQNGGKPTKHGLEILYKAYEKVGNHFSAAETLELLNEYYPNKSNFNKIGVLYSSAGHDDKALEYYKLAYDNDKDSTNAFNLAYKLKDKDKAKFKEILEESIRLDPEKPHSLFELGRLLKKEKDPKGNEMIQKAFEIWKNDYTINRLSDNNYSWLESAALELGMKDFAELVRESKPRFTTEKLYNDVNLTVTNKEEGLIKQ